MRKLDLNDYEVRTDEGKVIPYEFKRSCEVALFHPDLKLTSFSLLENFKVAQKISAANGSVLLEESEYQILKNSIERISGFTRQDVEFVRRILESPEVDVKEV